ncbi:penicillin-binding transpeptidase domain-containing protein (plasmid) [Streptomyces sp. NBC_01527]|uniref:penicillin-binding transpeptidase domain-containing protein n=1 Tax=unclassified Streptomyces TaxID=2593676 RepID=UPI002E1124BA|nr:penicillin-binding transpeptidase domain-containing protein [Streptomyces sp. NBC_01230]
MRNRARTAVIGSVFAIMVTGVGYGAYNIVTSVSGGGTTGTGPPSSDEIKETSRAFFAAWENGDAKKAAAYTNYASSAEELLAGYRDDAHLTDVSIEPGTPSGATVPFSVKATVSYKGKSKSLSYDSKLTVVRGETTGKALVAWKSSVAHPELKNGDTLVTGKSASPPAIKAVDRNNTVLTKDKYPSLGPILDALRERYGYTAGGTPGIELAIRHGNTGAPETILVTLSKGKPGKVRTTLSASAQAAAEKAVAQYSESSVVAVKPSTGEVLAVANHRQDGFNAAFLGKLAPGSTMKIISAATLIDNGITTASGPAPCPPVATWQSQTFHNLTGMEPQENATLSDSFSRSCNTAFVKYADELKDDSLTTEAEQRFGLGKNNWKTGIESFDGSVPASGGPDTAANMLGQGQVQISPLNMASVTATAMTGVFRQPIIVPRSLDGRELATAKGLSSSTVAQLRSMMNRTAVSGTAAQAMAGLGGSIGAKTGSAEVDGQAISNSWFTGYRGDVAAAALAQEGGHGGEAAGPIVAAVLRTGG